MNRLGFTAPCPTTLMTLNDRRHHMASARLTRLWRDAGFVHGRQARIPWRTSPFTGVATVTVTFHVRDPARRRDPHNWMPTIKATIDGLTDAGWWLDDSSAYVRVADCRFIKGSERLPHYSVEAVWDE